METFGLAGAFLIVLGVLLIYLFYVKAENRSLKRELKALTTITSSLLSGRSEVPHPFPTNES